MNVFKATCGYGILIRNRTCLPAGTVNCVGSSVQVETCDSGISCASMFYHFYIEIRFSIPTVFFIAPAPWNSGKFLYRKDNYVSIHI